MDKINVKKQNNEFLVSFPRTTFGKLDEIEKLSKEDAERLKDALKKVIVEVKDHFYDGAWDLDARYYFSLVLEEFFGCNMEDIIHGIMCTYTDTKLKLSNKLSYTNTKEKVYYDPIKNKIYISTREREGHNDVQLGDL